MHKLAIVFMLCFGASFGQVKKAATPAKKGVKKDSVVYMTDTVDQNELRIRDTKEFAVYSKRGKKADKRQKLCFQLVHHDTLFSHCINDSTVRNPETTKILFERRDGDTNYVLVFIDAFTKDPERPTCDAGKETKLFFVRWNIKSNQAIVKPRTINSCIRAITNMSKQPLDKWDGNSVLTVDYHKGGSNFLQFTFDPANYKRGFQGETDK